jgi:hypothetical protein
VRVDDSNKDGLHSPVRIDGGCEDGVSRGREDGVVPAVLPFSLAMSDEHELQSCANAVSDAATSTTDVDAATSAIDVHMPLPVTPKYKSYLPLSVSLHIINQREHMHCILISDQ